MTDDQTRPLHDTLPGPQAQAAPAAPEPTPTPTPSGPDILPPPAVASGTGRTRWVIGLGVAGIAIAAAVAAVMILGARPTPEALRYIPGGTAIVAEVRMDLPGDQLQKLGNFLAHFPGFQDQSILPDKIDEALSRLVESGPGDVDYRTDIKPWLAGPAFVGMSAPDPDAPTDVPAPIVSATTNGSVSCASVIEGAVTHETYQGLDLTISGDGGLACVVDGRQALLGDPAAVRAGLDAKAAGTGMDRSERYLTARAALAMDQLATVYLDGVALQAAMPEPELPDELASLRVLQDLAGPFPAWAITGFRAEDDAFVIDGVASAEPAVPATAGPSSSGAPLSLPPAHASAFVGLLPADTILFAEHQGTGVALQNLLATLRSVPEVAPVLGMLDGAGGSAQLLGWVEDAGVVVVGSDGSPSGGLLIAATDEAAAAERVTTVRGLLSLLGLQGGGIEVSETTIGGITVTNVVVTDLGSVVPPGSIPGGAPNLDAPLQLSFAAKGRVILLGVGEGFMTDVLSTPAGGSLADAPAYRAAVARGLADSRATLYVGVPAAIELAEGFVPAEQLAEWQAEYLPYIEPFEVVSITSSEDESTRRSRLVVTVSQP